MSSCRQALECGSAWRSGKRLQPPWLLQRAVCPQWVACAATARSAVWTCMHQGACSQHHLQSMLHAAAASNALMATESPCWTFVACRKGLLNQAGQGLRLLKALPEQEACSACHALLWDSALDSTCWQYRHACLLRPHHISRAVQGRQHVLDGSLRARLCAGFVQQRVLLLCQLLCMLQQPACAVQPMTHGAKSLS